MPESRKKPLSFGKRQSIALRRRLNPLRRWPGAVLWPHRYRIAWIVTGILVVAVLLVVAVDGLQSYRRDVRDAAGGAQHATVMVADHVRHSIREIRNTLSAVALDIKIARRASIETAGEDFKDELRETVARLPQLSGLLVLDETGKTLVVTDGWPLAGRDNPTVPFHALLDPKAEGNVVVGRPVRGAEGTAWWITVSRRWRKTNGEIGGVVVAALTARYFQDYYNAHDLGIRQILAFVLAGDAVLALSRGTRFAAVGRRLDEADLLGLAARKLTGSAGTLMVTIGAKRQKWLLSYRRLADSGHILVGAMIPVRAVFVAWMRQRILALAVGVAAIVLLVLFTFLMTREMAHGERADKARHMAEDRLREGIESLSEAFALFDLDDRLAVFNSHYRDMYSPCADIIRPGMPYAALLRVGAERGLFPEADGRVEAWVAEALGLHRSPAMTVERRLSGDRWIKISERRTRDGGHVGVRTDITDLKEREATLRTARDAAEAASRAKSEFLAMVSHELRTPLNAIIGFSEIMESQIMGPIGNDSYIAYAGDIRDSGEHLLSIINDILDLAKAESGKLALTEEEVDIGAVFDLCRKLILRRAEDGKVTLDSRLPDPCPTLWGDPRALKQILLNLLTNAIKFTQPGGQVTVEARREETGGLSFVVADTGIGMTDEDMARVLSPFVQGDGTLSRKFEGTGLGLTLVKHLVDRHDATFVLLSAVGVGTTVTVTFSADRVRDPAAKDDAEPGSPATSD